MQVLRKGGSPADLWEDLSRELESYLPQEELEQVSRAYLFASWAHKDQKRLSGEPFMVHPLGVARILADLRLDAPTIMAALLHDVDEDTSVQAVHIQATFGDEVKTLVEALTNLDSVSYKSKEHRKAESLRRLLIAMANDIRVILIKLADRLDNMHTIDALDKKKRDKFAQETLAIYAPIAHRLGIYTVKWQLEDLCFRVLEPDKYALLKQKIAMKRRFREERINKVIAVFEKEFKKHKLKAEITGRPKSLYSIWQKMKSQGKSFEEIYDVNAVRVIVDSVANCYRALGIIQSLWRHIPGTFDDYISAPKPNSYQSLHTAVVGPGNEPLEVQIRTKEMHKRAEYGVAAHWKYKEKTKKDLHKDPHFENKMTWLREVMETHETYRDSTEFLKQVMNDLFGDKVYVQTPKGDVVELPAGSTCIDFAYKIHTEVGNHCMGAKVNGRIVPLDTKLKNGDRVEILTSRSAKPSPDWINLVKCGTARNKIRAYFRKKKLEESIEAGEKAVMYQLTHAGFVQRSDKEEALKKVLSAYRCKSKEDLFSKVGYGELSASAVVSRARTYFLPVSRPNGGMLPRPKRRMIKAGEGILVENMPGILVRISRCCSPIVGDPIVGLKTASKGITIHHQQCRNLRWEFSNEKFVSVAWDYRKQIVCPVKIVVEGEDRVGLLSEVSACVKDANINVQSAQVKTSYTGKAMITMVLEIENALLLEKMRQNILRIKGVWRVEREFAEK